MQKNVLVTGAAGFIGTNVCNYLTAQGYAVTPVDKEGAEELLVSSLQDVQVVVHLGASVHTGDTDREAMLKNNFQYSRRLFDKCAAEGVPLIYASSAATYGDGTKGFSAAERNLTPLNAYADSKHLFDEYVRDAAVCPPQCVGLKFFNVYGPHESHKGRMASTVYFAYCQAVTEGVIKLFRSHNPAYQDGEQARDLLYVRDVAKVIHFFIEHQSLSGIFNVGTGEARTFNDLARAVFAALGKEPAITYIDTPEQFRGQYQYYTKADISQLRAVGYTEPFTPLEEGVRQYVQWLEALRLHKN